MNLMSLGNIIVYSDAYLKYRLHTILLVLKLIEEERYLSETIYILLFCHESVIQFYRVFLFTWQDMMRREVSKRRGGGFSFVIVIIVALIGIFLGYMMKS